MIPEKFRGYLQEKFRGYRAGLLARYPLKISRDILLFRNMKISGEIIITILCYVNPPSRNRADWGVRGESTGGKAHEFCFWAVWADQAGICPRNGDLHGKRMTVPRFGRVIGLVCSRGAKGA